MKADTERKKLYSAKLHKKKDFVHVHVAKDLRAKTKKRAVLAKKGDKVKVMRGSLKGKTGKIARVDYNRSKIFVEGLTVKNSKGRDALVPLEPSNLLLLETEVKKEEKSK